MEESSQLKIGTDIRSRKLEFIRWGSQPLIDFLESTGKNTGRQLGQYLVTAIINDYINENNLTNPIKKKEVICDEKLQALFGKKSLPRSQIFHLLEPHFAINQKKIFGVGVKISSTVENTSVSKCEPSCQNKGLEIYKSGFAAIVEDNIKLVYLRKTLVQNLAKVPELFEEKLTGSFVRIQSDAEHHQLHQVLGVKMTSKIHLQVSNCKHGVPLDNLSDENFSQRECEDLWRRIRDGFLKRPTIVELEVKAKMLHEDITRHDIQRDLQYLEKRIDEADANAKGWQLILRHCRNEKKVLERTSEQEKRLSRIPHVLLDESGPEAKPADALVKEKGSIFSPILVESDPEPEDGAANAIVRIEGKCSSPMIVQSETEPEAAAAKALVSIVENSSPTIMQSETDPEAAAANAIVSMVKNSYLPIIMHSEPVPEAAVANAIVRIEGKSSSPMIIQSEAEPEAAAADAILSMVENSSSPIIMQSELEPEAAAADAIVRREVNSSSPMIIQSETRLGTAAADVIVSMEGNSSSPIMMQSETEPQATVADAITEKGGNDSFTEIYHVIPIDADWWIDLSEYGALPVQPTPEVPTMNSTEVLNKAASPQVQKRDSTEILSKAAAPDDHGTTKTSSGAKHIRPASSSKSVFKTVEKRARQ